MSNGPRQQPDPAYLNQGTLEEIRKILAEIQKAHPNDAVLVSIRDTLAAGLTVNLSAAAVAAIASATRPQPAAGDPNVAALFKLMRGPDVHKTGI